MLNTFSNHHFSNKMIVILRVVDVMSTVFCQSAENGGLLSSLIQFQLFDEFSRHRKRLQSFSSGFLS